MMLFTDFDRQSSTWMKVREHLTEKLATLRVKNDATMTQEETIRMRARIEEVKSLMKLGDEPPPTLEEAPKD